MSTSPNMPTSDTGTSADDQLAADLLALGNWMKHYGQVHDAAVVLLACHLISRLRNTSLDLVGLSGSPKQKLKCALMRSFTKEF